MPDSVRNRIFEMSEECPNKIFANSGLYGVETVSYTHLLLDCLESGIQKRRSLGMESDKRCCVWKGEAGNRK